MVASLEGHQVATSVAAIAARHERTPAQVLPRWCVQRGVPVVSMSTNRERITENARSFDFALSPEDLAGPDALDRTGRTGVALERKWWSS
jgi:diketogulonate reductase-like aldo/keto reductase